jgi:hypothetical protein
MNDCVSARIIAFFHALRIEERGGIETRSLFKQVIDDIGNLSLPRYPDQVAGCFIAGTLVHTKEGLKPIEEIKIGDYVLSAPENGQGEKIYKRVVDTFAYDDKEIWGVKIGNWDPNALGVKNKQVRHLYCTGNHPFWAEGVGWTAAKHLRIDQPLRLADGSEASAIKVWPVLRTPLPGAGWVSVDTLGNWEGLVELGAHIVDFRNGCNLWQYPMWHREDAGVPYVGLFNSYGLFDEDEMIKIYEGNDRHFETRVFNLEVEGFHTYCVGDLGVWVHNRNCYLLELLFPPQLRAYVRCLLSPIP